MPEAASSSRHHYWRMRRNSQARQSGGVAAPEYRDPIPACTIRRASLDDYPRVTALQAKFGLSTRSYDDWAHLWVENPAFAPVRNTWPMGWALDNAFGQAVGYIGNIPLSYELGGKTLTVAAGCSWVVEEEYRSYAAWLMDTYFSWPADLYLNTTVGAQAAVPFSFFGSLRVPVGTWDRCAFVITNVRGFAESALRLRKFPAAKVLSFLAAPFLFLLNKFKLKCVRTVAHSHLHPLSAFDLRFDTFWAELKTNFPNVLLGNRSLAALNWHFGPALAQGNVWIITHASVDRLLAYGIFVRQDKPEIELKRVRLVDFQCLDGGNTLLIPMLEWATERCRREGIHMLEVIGYERDDQQLMALLPYQRPISSWQYYYLSKDKTLGMLLAETKAWRPYTFDGDATL